MFGVDFLAQYHERKRAEAAAKLSYMQITGECTAHPQVIPAAKETDVMWDQFSAVMEAGSADSRYQGVRAILFSVFDSKNERPFVMAAGGAGR